MVSIIWSTRDFLYTLSPHPQNLVIFGIWLGQQHMASDKAHKKETNQKPAIIVQVLNNFQRYDK